MWTTNYEWFGILSSISDPYCPFYDSTYLFDYCYYPLMTICNISMLWQCLHSGEWYPLSVSAIPHTMCFLRTTYQNRHSPYVTFNTIRSVNITTMKQDLWMIFDCSINNQQENDLFVINLSKGVLLVISTAFKRHSSIIFQRIPSVS